MTNSRLTDPEVLEWRYPVLVESFAIRRGSGGRGKHRGGDGVVRRIVPRGHPRHPLRPPPYCAMQNGFGRLATSAELRHRTDGDGRPRRHRQDRDEPVTSLCETPGGGYGVGEEKQAANRIAGARRSRLSRR
jgi:5-oxoprolinase (ATP-hydrolysing)